MKIKSNRAISILLLLAGSLLVGFSAGRWLAPAAAWFGPVLILRYARDNQTRRAFLLVFAAYFVAFLIGFAEIWLTWGPALMWGLATLYGVLWTLPFLADRLVSRKLTGFESTLAYPFAAATLELIGIYANPVGTWGSTGFTQYGNLPLMQLASVTGMIGITFLMGWFAAVVNWAWERRDHTSEMIRGAASFALVLGAVYLFGALRLNLAPISGAKDTVRVAGITANPSRELGEITAAKGGYASEVVQQLVAAHWDAYFEETIRQAEAGAELVLWPETAGAGVAADEPARIARAQEIARQHGIYLGIGLYTSPSATTATPIANKLLVIDPEGEIVIEHIKYGGRIFEGYRLQGDGKLQTAETPFGLLTGIICYDADYPGIVRQAGRNGAGLMLAPSSDWLEIDPVHTHMAVFRAIENGMSLVRQAEGGLSIAVDAYGRVLAQVDYFGATDRSLVAEVPTTHVATIYNLFGQWLEWLAPLGLVVLAIRAAYVPRDTRIGEAQGIPVNVPQAN